jgi:hypothetical protein
MGANPSHGTTSPSATAQRPLNLATHSDAATLRQTSRGSAVSPRKSRVFVDMVKAIKATEVTPAAHPRRYRQEDAFQTVSTTCLVDVVGAISSMKNRRCAADDFRIPISVTKNLSVRLPSASISASTGGLMVHANLSASSGSSEAQRTSFLVGFTPSGHLAGVLYRWRPLVRRRAFSNVRDARQLSERRTSRTRA